jgi:hypothetical protein
MRKLIYILFFSSFVSFSFAQVGGNPFSGGVLGDRVGISNPTQNVIGGAAANQDSTYLNLSNPASYSSLTFGQPLFATSLNTRFSTISENGSRSLYKSTKIEQLAFGLSFGKRFGAAIGFLPYATKNYEFYDFQMAGTDSVFYKYTGNNNVNSVFTGFSLKALDYKGYKINVGVQGSFIFGTMVDKRYSSVTSDFNKGKGGVSLNEYRLKDVTGQLGIQLSKAFKNHRLEIGATYIPTSKITSYRTDSLYYSPSFFFNPALGKINLANSLLKGTLNIPANINLGFIYHYEPKVDSTFTSKYLYKFSFLFNYETQNWKSMTQTFAATTTAFDFSNATKLTLGIEFTPHRNAMDKSKNIGYLAKIRYRIGYQTGTSPIIIQNKSVADNSINFGFGFPIPSQRSISNVNVGFRYGTRGNGNSIGIQEKYWLVNFGILLAPGKNDKWFRKYQYD